MKKQSLAIAALAIAAAPAFGQTYDNGGMDPQPNGCNSLEFSMIEAPSTVYGNNTIVTSFHQGDDFIVPAGQEWTPTELTWYLYQSFSPSNTPIVNAYIQLYEGTQAEMLAGTATFLGGDMTTNRLISSEFAGIYRVPTSNPVSCDRAIKENKIDMSWVGTLGEGQYWIEIGSTGDPSFSGPWANHVVPRDGNENSIVYTVSTGLWTVNNSNGVGWDYPFKLDYTSGGGGYTLTVSGNCPGTVNVAWSGATPNRQQYIIFAANTGSISIPNGPCQGTVLGLGASQARLVNTIGTGNGSGNVNGNAGGGACGGFLQLVTINNPCETSNVDQLP